MGYNTAATEWADFDFPSSVKDLIDRFFRLLDTDDSSVGNVLADGIFTPDARAGFAGHFFNGSDEIRRSRDNAWKLIKTRRHTVDKVYVDGKKLDDLLFIGTVTMELHNGKEISGDFTGRLRVSDPQSSHPRLILYQVWADSAPMSKALESK